MTVLHFHMLYLWLSGRKRNFGPRPTRRHIEFSSFDSGIENVTGLTSTEASHVSHSISTEMNSSSSGLKTRHRTPIIYCNLLTLIPCCHLISYRHMTYYQHLVCRRHCVWKLHAVSHSLSCNTFQARQSIWLWFVPF
jgi:hypothetical protein